jgi:uncharacterized membrane protein
MLSSENLKHTIIKSFFTGLSVLIPIYLTVYILGAIIAMFDRLIDVPPAAWGLASIRFPGMGLLLTCVLAICVGLLARFYIGKTLVHNFHALMERVPVVKSIYGLIHQVSEAMLGEGTKGFSRVVLVEWPRRECWVIGFVTTATQSILTHPIDESKRWLNIFIPTTPNPTSGFYFMVQESDVKDLGISVDQAFKVIISAGSFPVSQEHIASHV